MIYHIIIRFKYLGHEITDSICGKDHSLTRRLKAAASIHSIKTMGFNSNDLSLTTKILLYKVYVRPVLLYGCDGFMLSKKDKNSMKTLESNKLKEAFGLSHRLKTTDFMLALGLNSMFDRLNTLKLALFERLCNNNYTLEIINQLIQQPSLKKFSILSDCKQFYNALNFSSFLQITCCLIFILFYFCYLN